jgi:predicted nucleotidyltransferase
VNAQEHSLVDLATFLSDQLIEYMVIGGMANAVWGVARATLDIDVTIWTDESSQPDVVAILAARYSSRVAEPVAFVQRTRVLPLVSAQGVPMDVIFGLLPFEQTAVERATIRHIQGCSVRFCTAEDLILMKIISDRSKDIEDARQVVRQQKGRLDLDYLSPRIQELSDLLCRPDLLQRFSEWLEG